ncbi:MAG: MFS transporter [Salinibacterium amurskyense]
MAFATLWGGQAISLLLSGATTIALSLWVFDATESALNLSLVIALRLAISIYFAPLAGVIADRFPRKKLIVGANVTLGGLCGAIGFLLTLNRPDLLWLVLALLGLSGLADSLLLSALTASVRDIRRETDLTRVSGLIALIEASPAVIAPILGALLYSALGAETVLVIDAITFLVAAALAGLAKWTPVAVTRPEDKNRPKWRTFEGATEGIRILWRNREYRSLQIGNAVGNFTNGLASAGLSTLLLVSTLGGPAVLGLFNSGSALGLAVGAAAVAAWGSRLNRKISIIGGMSVAAITGRILVGLVSWPPAWVLGGTIRALCVQFTNAPLTAIWLEATDKRHQGKVFGARRLLGQGTFPIAVVMGGLAVDSIGAQNSAGIGLWIVGLGVSELAIVGVLGFRGVFRAVTSKPAPRL